MNIAVSFNQKYLNYAIVMLTSFCDSNSGHHDIYVLHSELDSSDIHKLEESLERYDVNINPMDVSNKLSNLELPVTVDWSREMYYRLLLPQELSKDVERIFYFDVDLIIHGSLDDLYYSDFDGADLMAALDSNNAASIWDFSDKVREMMLPLYTGEFLYFNSGVLLMNIAQMRDRYSLDYYLEVMKKWNFEMTAPDQDILNYVHHDKVKIIDWKKFDLFAKIAYRDGWTYDKVRDENKIIHFAGVKPWSFDNTRYEIEGFWWEYAALTPVYKELMESFVEESMSNSKLEEMIIHLENEKKEYKKAIEEAMLVVSKLK